MGPSFKAYDILKYINKYILLHNIKRYSVIFTSMATRAIHLEMAYSLDTGSCIRKCHTMVLLLKGQVTDMRSENGKKLVEAEKELRDALKEINHSQIEPNLLQDGIRWSFNPPKGAHHGGDWERMVRYLHSIGIAVLLSQPPTRKMPLFKLCRELVKLKLYHLN